MCKVFLQVRNNAQTTQKRNGPQTGPRAVEGSEQPVTVCKALAS